MLSKAFHFPCSGDTDEVKVLLEKEKDLTQHCLMNDPKSYGAWHHRGWAIAQMPDPEWSTEVQLTSKFLHMDERNFHCWDYRRFVLSQLPQLSGKGSELQFSTDAIHVNFSNYSAWHYRYKYTNFWCQILGKLFFYILKVTHALIIRIFIARHFLSKAKLFKVIE